MDGSVAFTIFKRKDTSGFNQLSSYLLVYNISADCYYHKYRYINYDKKRVN